MEDNSLPNGMSILNSKSENGGQFLLFQDETEIGNLDYRWAGTKKIIIDYVQVTPRLRGHNLAKLLVSHAVIFAKSQSIRIVPLCSYARIVMLRNPGMKEVMYPTGE